MTRHALGRRSLLKALGFAGLSAPFLAPQWAFAAEPGDPFLALVHPELRAIAAQVRKFAANTPPLGPATLAAQREGMARWQAPLRTDIAWERRAIAGRGGDVTVFVVNAGGPAGETRPAILHTHGGGFVSGLAEISVRAMQDLCAELGCVAVSVEYRLAPETTYAGSIEDTYAGLKWLHANAASLGVDPARIAVMGESAGGGHAALLALTARDRGEVPVAFQCLIYPMLDDRTGSTRSMPDHVGQLIWNAQSNRFGWQSFLGMKPGGRNIPVAAVPARRTDLAGLPPAFIGVGSLDLFVDEDVDYAQRLNAAGVPAQLIVVPGAFHGFDAMPSGARIARWFNAAKIDALRRGLGIAIP